SRFIFFSLPYAATRVPLSVPTRRSSDLECRGAATQARMCGFRTVQRSEGSPGPTTNGSPKRSPRTQQNEISICTLFGYTDCVGRSEEHTSELQSRENLVCRLLLEKKKKT